MARTDRRPRRRLDPDSRRAAILDAAAAAFAERPYSEVKIAAVAAQAGASNALLYRYFDGKEDLYLEVVRQAIASLLEKQTAALEALPPGVPVRDRIRRATEVYLDVIAAAPDTWALPMQQPGSEPAAVAELRAAARRDYVADLGALLLPSGSRRHEYALWGYLGFVDAACLRWAELGSATNDRWALIEAALGALEGALGDWSA